MGRRHRRKRDERTIARRRIGHLFELARRRLRRSGGSAPDVAGAQRAVGLGRRIAMRYQTGMPAHLRDRLCRACTGPLVPGQTARVRVEQGAVRTTCLACGATQRRPYLREQKARRLERAALRDDVPVPGTPTPAPVAHEVEA